MSKVNFHTDLMTTDCPPPILDGVRSKGVKFNPKTSRISRHIMVLPEPVIDQEVDNKRPLEEARVTCVMMRVSSLYQIPLTIYELRG